MEKNKYKRLLGKEGFIIHDYEEFIYDGTYTAIVEMDGKVGFIIGYEPSVWSYNENEEILKILNKGESFYTLGDSKMTRFLDLDELIAWFNSNKKHPKDVEYVLQKQKKIVDIKFNKKLEGLVE